MKRLFIIVLLCSSSVVFSQGTKKNSKPKSDILEITYTNQNNINSKDLDQGIRGNNLPEETIQEIKTTLLNAKNRYLLLVNTRNSNSIYEKDPSFVFPENNIDDNTKDFTVFNMAFLVKTGHVFSGQYEFGKSDRSTVKSSPGLKWKITSETKKIGEWKATKAIPQDDIFIKAEVWFTEDVALQCGPMHYFGLPGLVLEVTVPDLFTLKFSGMTSSKIDLKTFEKKSADHKLKAEKDKNLVSMSDLRDIVKKAREKQKGGM